MLNPEILRQEKIQKRRQLLLARREIPSEIRRKAAEQMHRFFQATMTYQNAGQILFYAEKNDEIPVTPLFSKAHAEGKICLFPRCISSVEMKFYLVSSLDQLREGTFHIREPEPFFPEHCAYYNDICIVPALAFDRTGHRIGYGKGYYDRFLSGFHGVTVGFCYTDFVENHLPVNQYDVAVDILITERGLFRLRG